MTSAYNIEEHLLQLITLVIIIFMSFIFVLIYTFIYNEFSVFLFYILCLIIGPFFIILNAPDSKNDFQFLTKLYFLTFSINIIIIFIFLISFYKSSGTTFLLIKGMKIPDDQVYYNNSIAVISQWLKNESADSIISKYSYHGYIYFLSCIYYICSYIGDLSSITPRVINAMIGSLVSIVIFMLTKLIYDIKIAKRAALLCAFFPVFTYYSALILRDIIIVFLILYSVYLFIKYFETKNSLDRYIHICVLIITLIVLYSFRNPSALVLILSFIIFLFFKRGIFFKISIIISTIAVIILTSFYLDLGPIKIQKYLSLWKTLNDVFYRTESHTSMGMKYIINAPFPLNLLLRFPYTIIFPFPPITEFYFPSIIRGLGASFWYFLIPFWIHGIWKSKNNPYSNLLLLISFIILVGISFTTVDTRHKTQFLGFALIHASSDWIAFSIHKKVILWTVVILILFSISYAVLKINNLNLI